MTDTVYASGKQHGSAAPAKNYLYNPVRQPAATSSRRRNFTARRCVCLSCFWAALILIGMLLLAAVAATVFFLLYRPHRPTFSVTAVRISYFNLTTAPFDETTHLTTKMDVTLSGRNPNKKGTFYFNAVSVAALSDSVVLSNGSSAASFSSSPGGIFVIHATLGLDSQLIDTDSLRQLKPNLKRKNGLPMKIVIDTVIGVKLDNLKMKKLGIRVKCAGIKGTMPKGKAPALANTSDSKCKVDLKIKIFKWTF